LIVGFLAYKSAFALASEQLLQQGPVNFITQMAEKFTGHTSAAVNYATEAPFLQNLGMETLILGPGNIDQAHQVDEYLALDQIEPCVDLLRNLITHFCQTPFSPAPARD
jgi:acetylornithine deacetylase/succinyl-diaminopimelate desuccinylase-like protein